MTITIIKGDKMSGNSCDFEGWITHEPEYGQTNGGKTYCNFSIGCKEQYEGKTTYLKFTAYGKHADNLKAKAGKGLFITLWHTIAQNVEYNDKTTGDKKWYTRYLLHNEKSDFTVPSAFKGGSEDNLQAEKSFSESYASDGLPFRN